jgi:SAM-dependent methyltransferase
MNSLYTDPLVYDVLHADGTAGEVRMLERLETRHIGAPPAESVWLEPACGTGRYLLLAGAKGRRVIGFDLEPSMIDYARERFKARGIPESASLFVGDMTAFSRHVPAKSVTLAFNLINTIRHLPTDRAMLAHFADIRRSLAPRGIYVVGLSLAAYGLEPPTEDVWTGNRRGIKVRQIVNYTPATGRSSNRARTEHVASHLVIDRRGSTEHADAAYTLRSYSLAQWRSLVRRAAFEIVEAVDHDAIPLAPSEPGYFIFVLRPSARRTTKTKQRRPKPASRGN